VAGDAGDTSGPFFLPHPAAVDSGSGRTVILVGNAKMEFTARPSERPALPPSAPPPLCRCSQERQENTPGIIKFFRGPRKQTLIAPSASAIFSPSHPPSLRSSPAIPLYHNVVSQTFGGRGARGGRNFRHFNNAAPAYTSASDN